MASPHSTSAYDHLIKILLVGDAGTNKRALLAKYIGEEDLSDATTLGLDYKLKDIVYQGKRIKLQLWDTAGQERFRSVTASYYRGAHGALLVFSLRKQTSFVSLSYWLEEIKNNSPSQFKVLLVATGATEESEEDAEVSLDLARTFAKEKNLQLVTCDVEDGDRVDTAFATLIDIIMSNILPSTLGDSIMLNQSGGGSGGGGRSKCCNFDD